MKTKNNAARVAVKAAAFPGATEIAPNRATVEKRQKTGLAPASQVVTLPTVQQFMRLACGSVAAMLREVLAQACADGDCCDENADCVDTVDLALSAVGGLAESLTGHQAPDVDAFSMTWWRASCAVRLAQKSFKGKETPTWYCLSSAVSAFEALSGTLEFLSSKHEKGEAA